MALELSSLKAYDLTRHEIQVLCQKPNRQTISITGEDREVIKIGRYAIKFGQVSKEEAINQHAAFRLLDSSLVKVPEVYDFFHVNGQGYLVMEYIAGRKLEMEQDSRSIWALAAALSHLHTFVRSQPGPLCSGRARGILWTDAPELYFSSKDSLVHYLDSRLIEPSEKFDLGASNMVLCHLDAAPRNLLITDNGIICLLDWESAGYYPSFFELCAVQLNTGPNCELSNYSTALEHALKETEPLDQSQLRNLELLNKVVGNSIRYNL